MLHRQIKIPFAVASIRWIPICSLALIGLIGILPFINRYHSQPIVSFYSEWLALTLGTAAGVALLTRQFWLHLVVPKTTIYILLLAAVFIIQAVLIPGPYAARWLFPALYLAWAILLTILAAWLRQTLGKEKIVEALAWFLVIGGILSAFAGLVQYIGYGGWVGQYVAFKQSTAVYGNIAQANHFASHLLLATAGLCYLFSRRSLSTALGVTLLVFFALMVSLSTSRAVLLYAISLSALSLAGYLKSRDAANTRLGLFSVLFLATYIGAQYLFELLNPWLMEQVKDWSQNYLAHSTALEKFSKAPLGLEIRTSEWHKAWLMFLDAPVFGIGSGNYAWHSFSYQTLPEFSGIEKPQLFGHSHNLFTQIAAETGVAGLTILLVWLAGWAKQLYRNWTQPDWFIAAVMLVIFVHSNLEFPLWYSYFLGIAAFMFGLGDSRTMRPKVPPRSGQIGAGLVLLLGGVLLGYTLSGYRDLLQLSLPYSLLTPQEKRDTALDVADNPLLAPYAEISLLAVTPVGKDGINENIAILTRVTRNAPDSDKVYALVIYLALNNQPVEASELLYRAAQAYPDQLPRFLRKLTRVKQAPELLQVQKEAGRLLLQRQKENESFGP